MGISEQKALLQFVRAESVTVQCVFRIQFNYNPTNDKIHGWHHQFEDTGCLCKGKSAGRLRVIEECIERVRESFLHSPRNQFRRIVVN